MRRVLPVVFTGLGLVLAGVGTFMFVTGGHDGVLYEASYAPLAIGAESVLRFTGTQAVGAVLAVLGLVLLTAVGGWRLGRRRRRSNGPASA